MPSKTKLRTELSSDDKLNHKKSSRHHHGSKIPQDQALSPRATHTLKFKEKTVSPVSPVHPPQANLPFKFINDDHKGHSKAADNQQQVNKVGSTSREEELVKYMSKLPSYLQTGERVVQDNVLNFGVLDWERLEKWKRKQDRRDSKKTGFGSSSSATSTTATSSSGSRSNSSSSSRVDSRAVKPPRDGERRKATNHARDSKKQGSITRQQHEFDGDASGVKLTKVGEKKGTLYQKSKLGPRTSSHPGNEKSSSSKEKITDPDSQREGRGGHREDRSAKGKCPETHSSCQQHSLPKKDTFILLLPKDFSRPNSSEISERTSLDYGASSSEFNWNSFSDVFSMEEVQSEDSFLDFPHSCPLTYTDESEAELDLKLDSLVNARGVVIDSDLPSYQSPKWDEALAAASKIKDAKNNSGNISETSKGLEQEAAGPLDSETANISSSRRFSFGMGRLSRSLSFREGLALPQMSSTYVSAKSGPVRTEVPTDCPGSNASCRIKNSSFRRLLDPWLKHRATKSFSSTQSLQSCPEDNLDDFNIRPGSALEALFHDKNSTTSTATAYLQVAFKGGLPWFRFVVKTTSEMLASTVKKLSTFEKDDPNWLYTFYSVHKVKKKSSGWKHQVSKQKNTELSSTPVGQMKVSDAHIEQGEVMKHKDMESVLYGVDLNNTDESTTEFTANKELAAIVVKMPGNESLSTTTRNDSQNGNFTSEFEFSDNAAEENEKSGSIVVILPSGYHALPADGVPSPLIKRWRTGGLCDCGGWDVGCKLRILTNETPEDKISRAYSLNDRCDLFVQGAAKQTKPIFSIVSDGHGIFSVEYDAVISSLQAFAICVAFVNSQKIADSLGQKLHNETMQEREKLRTPVDMLGDGHAKYAAYPPHSPVGRV